MKKKFGISLLFILIFFSIGKTQTNSSGKEDIKIKIIPGEHYKAGWLHNLFFGAHWRDLWTSPLEAEVLDLDKFEGGIKPYKKGGGLQTKSLRFKGNDGRVWKFRSIDKDPSKVLPEDLRESLVADVIRDQISSANPLAPLIVVPMLNVEGVLQAKPKIVILPDDERLGEFREEFGGLLGMIEIHPEADKDSEADFENAEKILDTFDLLHRLEEKRDEKVQSKEFLKARLMDVFFGDWDRHTDQWRWAKYEINNAEYWYPIPRDRDQAFSKFDGLFPAIAAYYTPQLVSFNDDYPQLEDLTWNGRFLDRRFLSELTKTEWDSVAEFVKNKLTDSLIEASVKLLPENDYKIAGPELAYDLKSRRDKLLEASDEYYRLINKIVDIYGSNKKDYAEIKRLDNSFTEVKIFKRDKDLGKKGKPIYSKIFDNDLTREIRIYLLDDDDKAVVTGEADSSPMIRIISGEGEDELVDSSRVKGYFLSFLPIPDAESKTGFYDSGNKTLFSTGPSSFINREKIPDPKDDFERYEPKLRDRGHDWIINPIINYNSDDGLIFGGGPILVSYAFRTAPYEYWMTLTASYATAPKSYRINYNGIFDSIIKNAPVELNFLKSELNLTKYYGYGNETGFDENLEKNNFYRLKQELLNINPNIIFKIFNNNFITLGLSYSSATTSLSNSSLIKNFPDSAYGEGTIHSASALFSYTLDSRDVPDNAQSGYFLKAEASYYPGIWDIKDNFTRTSFDMRGYFSAEILTPATLALRAGGGKIFGSFPFYKAVFLGGKDNLRGYSRERFSGNASLFSQAELRIFLANLNIVIPGKIGVHFFGETGRVYTEEDNSKKWHPSYGGGLWISFLKRQINLSLSIAGSPESTLFYFGTRLDF
ncbi:MAG TPA: BamA/TamA family outer membrane protein [Ignavibacteriaceae bacterium]|nr:BamA/TamA family outer membrane protein [Ignavibacteriaceae bacterium]